MRGYCTKCGRVFEGQMLCPQCGEGLVEEVGELNVPPPPPGLEDAPDGPSFLRRLALGGITLLGLYHGFKHLAIAGLLSYSSANILPPGALACLLIAATLAAAVVAGTVNRKAELTGLLLATAATAGFLAPEFIQRGDLPEEWLVGIPTLMVMVGVAGGAAGRLMIPPAPSLPRFNSVDTPIKAVRRQPVRLSWWRIVAGSVLVVLGTNYAEFVRYWLLIAFGGKGGAFGAAPLVAWQISIIAAVIGGVLAGANTRAGFRQGLFTGLLASAGTVVAIASVPSSPPLVFQFWLDQVGASDAGLLPFVALGGTVWVATAVGGWLGEQLIPPRRRP